MLQCVLSKITFRLFRGAVGGDQELERSVAALWWSALAAGLTMGLSLMAMGLFYSRLPEGDSSQVIASLGYSAGFLAVILARQQLFTENTLTAVLPVMTKPTFNNVGRLLRLWGVVLFGSSVVILAFLPWLDHSPARSLRYRPTWHSYLYALFALVFVTLGYLGTQLPTPAFTIISQVCTLAYFAFFLLMPWWSTMGKFKPLPTRLTFTPH